MTVWTDELLNRLAHEGDDDVDDVIKKHAALPGASAPRDLIRDIGQSLELPPEKRSAPINDYLNDRPPLPDWANPVLMRRSADFFDLRGLEIGSALFLASLPEAYAGARGARVLRLTGRLVTDVVRRVNETAQMVFNATDRDALDPERGQGYQDVRRVRLMHAAIRFLILNDPEVKKTDVPAPGKTWCLQAGKPLNQEDLLGALMTFTVVIFECLDKLGVGYEEADAEAYMHTWSVIGHLMGIDPTLLPISVPDAQALTARIRARQQKPSDDAVELGDALVEAIQRSLRWRAAKGLPGAMLRFYCGDKVATIVGQGKAPKVALFFEPVQRLLRFVGLAQQHNRAVADVSRHLTSAILRQFMDSNRPGRPGFQLPLSLQANLMRTDERWHL